MNGIFPIEKPVNQTSQQVLSKLNSLMLEKSERLRTQLGNEKEEFIKEFKATNKGKSPTGKAIRRFNKLKMGQGGTLDPMASGLLVVGLNNGTKGLQKYLTDSTKSYTFKGILGQDTMSGDNQEDFNSTLSVNSYEHLINLTDEKKQELEQMIKEAFVGKSLNQVPPVYSALKINGRRLYDYIRKGEEIPGEIEPRVVELLDIEFHKDNFKLIEQEPLSEEPKEFYEEKDLVVENNEGSNSKPEKQKRLKFDGNKNLERLGPHGSLPVTDELLKQVSNYKNQIKLYTVENNEKGGVLFRDDELNKITSLSDPFFEKMKMRKVPLVELNMTIKVSSGFYVRSIVRDICKLLKTSGYMTSLVRVAQKQWDMKNGCYFKLEDFENEENEPVWYDLMGKVCEDEETGCLVDVRSVLDNQLTKKRNREDDNVDYKESNDSNKSKKVKI
ncbi:hypothetical protein QEN19_001941 [Hanseniaspora menglaensis]